MAAWYSIVYICTPSSLSIPLLMDVSHCLWMAQQTCVHQTLTLLSSYECRTLNYLTSLWSLRSPTFFSIVQNMYQFSSVSQLCPTLCNPMNRSTPDLPVHHQLPESTQTHVLCVGDAIQPSHPLSSPSPPTFNLSQHRGLLCFHMNCDFFCSGSVKNAIGNLIGITLNL